MTDRGQPATAPERSDAFPAGIPFIVGNEGAERFSYYGMRAVLYVYLTALYVQFAPDVAPAASAAAEAQATGVTHLFFAGVYAFPMIGAILADRLLGKYQVILWVSLLYCVGHGVLAFAGRFAEMGMYDLATTGMYIGLVCIAVGAGGIKPCVSANVGDQFTSKNQHLVTRIFQIFYFIINFGSFFSTLITPFLYRAFGPEVAFGVPGVMMGLATLVFWLGRKRFVHVPPNPGGKLGAYDFVASSLMFAPIVAIIAVVFIEGAHFELDPAGMSSMAYYGAYVTGYLGHLLASGWPYFLLSAVLLGAGLFVATARNRERQDDGFLAVLLFAWQRRGSRAPGQGFFDVARAELGDDAADGPPAVLRILLVFSMVSVFWALFDQHASTWVAQAGLMARDVTYPLLAGQFLVYATVFLALAGGIWLFLWISNHPPPNRLVIGALISTAAVGVVLLAIDLALGQTGTITFQAAQIQALNPLMVMIIIPLLNVAVYGPLERRGIPFKPLQKMTVGMFLAAVAFAVAALVQESVEAASASGESVHILWQVGQYVIMTTSEVLVSITGLEFAYTQAPRKMKSTIMGFWLLGVTFGNVLVAFLAPMQKVLALSEFFWVFTGLMVAAAIAFAVLAVFYKGKTYLQAEAA